MTSSNFDALLAHPCSFSLSSLLSLTSLCHSIHCPGLPQTPARCRRFVVTLVLVLTLIRELRRAGSSLYTCRLPSLPLPPPKQRKNNGAVKQACPSYALAHAQAAHRRSVLNKYSVLQLVCRLQAAVSTAWTEARRVNFLFINEEASVRLSNHCAHAHLFHRLQQHTGRQRQRQPRRRRRRQQA